MKRRLLCLAAAAAMLLALFVGCGRAPKKPLTIWHASDLHYLAPELIEDRDGFISVMNRSDGKVTHYTPEICAGFVEAALEAHPDAIILSGDLTLNGSVISHTQLVQILKPLADEGIRVLVIPGNHDIGGTGYRFAKDGPEPIPAVTTEEFVGLYSDFGYADALSRDDASLSYMADLDGGVRVLMLDVNSGSGGTVTTDTLKWAEAQLKKARRDGCTVIGVTHQNICCHSPMFTFGYELNNAGELSAIYEKYGVQLNLSGHLHIQHIVSGKSTTEIAVSALSVTPNQYGVLTLDDSHGMSYATSPLTVTAELDGKPLDFTTYAAQVFDNCTIAKNLPRLEEAGFSGEELAAMLDVSVRMNREYFWGTVTPPDEETYRLLADGSGFSSGYLSIIYSEAGIDHNHWHS